MESEMTSAFTCLSVIEKRWDSVVDLIVVSVLITWSLKKKVQLDFNFMQSAVYVWLMRTAMKLERQISLKVSVIPKSVGMRGRDRSVEPIIRSFYKHCPYGAQKI